MIRTLPDVGVLPAVEMRRELVFLYNADGRPWSQLFDAAHKLVSPTTYSCRLCALTYGAVSMRSQWLRIIRSLPHDVRFGYRDQWRRKHGTVPPLPVLLERRDGEWVPLLSSGEINACADLDALVARVREVLQ